MAQEDQGDLEPPTRTSIDDPGAHELQEPVESSDSDDHFSDAHSGLEPSIEPSPTVPTTRIEKVDDEPSYGEVPGTEAYNMRTEDAEPDQIAMVPEYDGASPSRRPSTPGDLPIPTTVVEKIDPDTPSHGEVPGTPAYEKRKADAVPDLVLDSTPGRSRSNTLNPTTRSRAGSTPGDLPIPKTVVERVDSVPSHGEVPGTAAYELRKEDAQPDDIVEVSDVPESSSPTLSLQGRSSPVPAKTVVEDEYNEEEDGDDRNNGDDADDADKADDADSGEPETTLPSQPISVTPSFPVLDLTDLNSPEDVLSATEPYLDHIFPSDTIDTSALPPLGQPQSHISHTTIRITMVTAYRIKSSSSTSLDSQGNAKTSRSDSRRRKGPPPAPQLDLVSARQTCEITEEALNGLTMDELKEHVKKLEEIEVLAKELLEYWTMRTDEKLGDREASRELSKTWLSMLEG
ncbi:hypothetical protein DID88_004290 [Monilinia fructigena]|uniref:Uncharacterized protein n=1 Tax=Monilinia fructigena TaxID=38457 RepID=A0A395ISF2_9HELO|nr:hypothetical protein DID88_004290 [Monilinia fructigena]